VYYPPRGQWNDPDPKLVEQYAQWGLVWGSGPHRVRYSVAFDAHEFIYAADQMLKEAGVRVLYQTWACEPLVENGSIKAVVIQNKAGRQAIAAKVVIDATGDGDIFAAAGESFELERVHPWLWFRIGGIRDIDAAIAGGAPLFRTPNPGQALMPWGSVTRIDRKIDATDPRDLTFAELACRRLVMEEFRALRERHAELRDAHLCEIARLIGVTESRRLVGRTVLAHADRQRSLPGAIAITGHWTKYGAVYAIPYGCLQAREVGNLLAVGRCISADHRTHNATKEIPPCFATGEAAGSAAVLALEHGGRVADVPVEILRAKLRARGAIVDYSF
jgi:FAD dependent oxidoreductase